jgi:hypothetical protein
VLGNVDRFGHFDIRLGDTARFPLDRLGNPEVYNRTFEVVAFGGYGKRHCVLVRRRHDGLIKWIANQWFDAYANPFLKGGRQYPMN